MISRQARLEVAGYLAPEHKGYLREIEKDMQAVGTMPASFITTARWSARPSCASSRILTCSRFPTTYAEAKGLPVLEAMASGVPVVQPARGSFPEILERTGGGLLCEPNDAASLAEAIHSLWKNPELANDLAKRGAAGVREHYTVSRMASRALEVYASLTPMKRA